MSADDFDREVAALAVVFPGARRIGEPHEMLVLLPEVAMNGEWTPTPVRALLNCTGWPEQRPKLLVEEAIKRNGVEPPAFSREYFNGETWFSYSFNIPYDPSHSALVPIARGFLARFDGRP